MAANHPERYRTQLHTESESESGSRFDTQSDINLKTKNLTLTLFSKHISKYGSDFEYNMNLILTLKLSLTF